MPFQVYFGFSCWWVGDGLNYCLEDDEEGAVEGEKKKKKKKKKKQQPEGGEGGEAVEGGEAPVDDGNDSDGPVRKR